MERGCAKKMERWFRKGGEGFCSGRVSIPGGGAKWQGWLDWSVIQGDNDLEETRCLKRSWVGMVDGERADIHTR